MRQLITRLGDDLGRRLKERAAAEGRSVNALVTEILSNALAEDDERAHVTLRLARSGLRVEPRQPEGVPPRDAVISSTRGTGTAMSEAVAAERSRR